MGRGRKMDQRAGPARELFEDGWKMKDIAERLQISPGTLRRWKSEQGWEAKGKKNVRKSSKITVNCSKKRAEKNKNWIEEDLESLENSELTEKQELFCLYYIRNFNATKSYQKVYGCGYEAAAANASRLLKKDKIISRIQELKKERFRRDLLTEEDLLQKYVDIAHGDITDFVEFGTKEVPLYDKNGVIMIKNPKTGKEEVLKERVNYLRLKDASEIDGTLISEISIGKGNAVKIKLKDSMKAMNILLEKLEKQADDDNTGVIMLAPVLDEEDDEDDMDTTEEAGPDDAKAGV